MISNLEKIQRNFVRTFAQETCILLLMMHAFGVTKGLALYIGFGLIALFLVWPLVLWRARRRLARHIQRRDLRR